MSSEPMNVDVGDVLTELDELGRAKWDVAVARVQIRALQTELARISNHDQEPAPDA